MKARLQASRRCSRSYPKPIGSWSSTSSSRSSVHVVAAPSFPSALSRTVDISYPSNRFALVGFAVAAAALGIKALATNDLTLVGAVFAAVAVFLGWAAGRELDPASTGVAALAMVVSLVFALFATPAALATGVALIGLRVVAGTVSAPATWMDTVVFLAIGAIAGATPILWIVGLSILMWLLRAPEVGSLRPWVTATFLVGVAGGLGWLWYQWNGGRIEDVAITATAYVLAAAAGAAMMFAARPVSATTPTDAGGEDVDPVRIRFARLAAGSYCMWAAVIGGTAGFWAIGPVFAALVAAAIYRFFVQPAAIAQ